MRVKDWDEWARALSETECLDKLITELSEAMLNIRKSGPSNDKGKMAAIAALKDKLATAELQITGKEDWIEQLKGIVKDKDKLIEELREKLAAANYAWMVIPVIIVQNSHHFRVAFDC